MRLKDQAVFLRQLATMLRAGIAPLRCVETLERQNPNRVFRQALKAIEPGLLAGESFVQLLSKQNFFPPYVIVMLQAGEASGHLDLRMEEAAAFLERVDGFRKKVLAGLIRPFFTLNLAFFMIPLRFLLIGSPDRYWETVTASLGCFYGLLLLLWIVFRLLMHYENRSVSVGKFLFFLPVAGSLIRLTTIERFLRVYASLTGSGFPVLQIFRLAPDASGNAYFSHRIALSLDTLGEGSAATDILLHARLFPRLVEEFLVTGEASGNVEGMANKAADYMEVEAKTKLEHWANLVPPIVIVLTGVYVGYEMIQFYKAAFSDYYNQMEFLQRLLKRL